MATTIGSLGFDLVGYAKNLSRDVDRALSTVETKMNASARRMTGIGAKMSASITAPFAAIAAGSLKAFGEQDAVEKRLAATLERSGKNVEANMARFKAYAAELQATTTQGDESTLALINNAVAMGASSDAAERLARASIDMAAALGRDVESTAAQLTKTLGGYAGELGEVIPELKELTAEQLKAGAAVELIAAKFKGAASEGVSEYELAMAQAKNAAGDAAEVIGGHLAPIVTQIAEKIKGWAISLQGLNPELVSTAVKIGAVAAVAGPLVLTIAALTKAVSAAIAVVRGLAIAVGAVTAAIALVTAHPVVAALTAITAATLVAIAKFEELREIMASVFGDKLALDGKEATGVDFSTGGLKTGPFKSRVAHANDFGSVIANRNDFDFSAIQKANKAEAAAVLEITKKKAASAAASKALSTATLEASAATIPAIDAIASSADKIPRAFKAGTDSATEFSSATYKEFNQLSGDLERTLSEGINSAFRGEFDLARFGDNILAAFRRDVSDRLSRAVFEGFENSMQRVPGILGDAMAANSKIADRSARDFSGIWQGAIGSVANMFKDWLGGMASAVSSLARWIWSSLSKVFSSYGVSAGGGVGGGGSNYGAYASAAVGIIGGLFGGAYAGGGRPQVGRMNLVGERGPELFVPDTSGTIVPNHALAGMGGGGSGSPTIVVENTFQPGVTHAELEAILPEIQSTTTEGILDGISRGGGFRNAFKR